MDIQSKLQRGGRGILFELLMLGQWQEGLAATGVYARENLGIGNGEKTWQMSKEKED